MNIWQPQEEELHKFSLAEFLTGQTVKARKMYRVCNERITNIVNDYSNRTVQLPYIRFIHDVLHVNIYLHLHLHFTFYILHFTFYIYIYKVLHIICCCNRVRQYFNILYLVSNYSFVT